MRQRHKAVNTCESRLFILLHKLFGKKGITKEWLEVLADSEVHLFNEGIVSIRHTDDLCIINSGTPNNEKFSFGMMRLIRETILTNDKVVVQSIDYAKAHTVFNKMGFGYNSIDGYFYKGF